jgi:deoxyadenosine/deoxycytidine kinase
MKGFIGIAGNIGVGKTTLTEWLAKRLNWDPSYESVSDNPFLSDFYGDMPRWAFHLQIYFLQSRYSSHLETCDGERGVIQDRTIWEDVEIFARNLHEMGHLSERDWQCYYKLFQNMVHFLRQPDLLIYLRSDVDTLLTRIAKRGRDYEQSIDPNYLRSLNSLYERWIHGIRDIPVLVVDADHLNIFEDHTKMRRLLESVEAELSRRQLSLNLGAPPKPPNR